MSAALAACAAQVQQTLVAVPGVKDVSVRYPEGHAVITLDATSPLAHEHLRKAVERWAAG
ncbi:MAG: cation transporter [Candidatus Entotheonellia bacterium]